MHAGVRFQYMLFTECMTLSQDKIELQSTDPHALLWIFLVCKFLDLTLTFNKNVLILTLSDACGFVLQF